MKKFPTWPRLGRNANALYSKWMKKYGTCIGEHKAEIVKDIKEFTYWHMSAAIGRDVRKKKK